MPVAKKPTRSPAPRTAAQFKEPVALKRLSRSLDAAQEALAELRKDAEHDVGQGARDLYKDLRTFISSARRDSVKLAKALRRDFEQGQKRLADPSRPARASAQPRVRGTARSGVDARQPRRARAPARTSMSAPTEARSANAAAGRSPSQPVPAGTTRSAILQALASGDAMTATQIAAASGLRPGTVSTTLSRLAKTGEIAKATHGYQLRHEPGDGP